MLVWLKYESLDVAWATRMGDYSVTSPNISKIPFMPTGQVVLCMQLDGRYGQHNFIICPQAYSFEHLHHILVRNRQSPHNSHLGCAWWTVRFWLWSSANSAFSDLGWCSSTSSFSSMKWVCSWRTEWECYPQHVMVYHASCWISSRRPCITRCCSCASIHTLSMRWCLVPVVSRCICSCQLHWIWFSCQIEWFSVLGSSPIEAHTRHIFNGCCSGQSSTSCWCPGLFSCPPRGGAGARRDCGRTQPA